MQPFQLTASWKTLIPIFAIPAKNRAQLQFVYALVIINVIPIVGEQLALILQLFQNTRSDISFGTNRRATSGRTNKRNMNARLAENGTDHFMFDIVQANGLPSINVLL